MAKRLYFSNSTTGFTPSGFQGTWNLTTSAVIKALSAAPAGAAATIAITKSASTNPYNVCWGRFVSAAIAKSGTLSGLVNWAVGVKESSASLNAFLRIHIYVTVGASSTVRGTLFSNFTDTVEFTTTATGITSLDQSISSVAVAAGDLIVVEIGYQAKTASTGLSGTMNYGNTGSFDLFATDTVVTSEPGWIQFSDPNGVISAPPPSPCNSNPNPSCGNGSAVGWSNSANVSGTTGTAPSGFSRTTSCNFTISTTGYSSCIPPKIPVAAGEVWSAYIEVQCSVSRAGNVYMNFFDAKGAFLSPNPFAAVTYNTGVISITFDAITAPANAVYLGISVEGPDFVAGDIVAVSCVRFDKVLVEGYEDGDSSGWAWDGTSEVSTSHRVAGAPPGSFLPFFLS